MSSDKVELIRRSPTEEILQRLVTIISQNQEILFALEKLTGRPPSRKR
jgi:hypothetical protein